MRPLLFTPSSSFVIPVSLPLSPSLLLSSTNSVNNRGVPTAHPNLQQLLCPATNMAFCLSTHHDCGQPHHGLALQHLDYPLVSIILIF